MFIGGWADVRSWTKATSKPPLPLSGFGTRTVVEIARVRAAKCLGLTLAPSPRLQTKQSISRLAGQSSIDADSIKRLR